MPQNVKRYVLLGGLAAFCLMTGALTAAAEDWNQWRGPNRDGHVIGFKNPATWPGQLTKKWTVTVGEGHSSPIIVGNRAYVLVRRGEQEQTICLDMGTGKTVWQNVVDAPFGSVIFPAQRLGKSPRSTPVYSGGKLYVIGVNGLMTCFNAQNGKIVWRRDFAKTFPTPYPICGASLSPLVDGKKIYVHVGHDNEGAFLALDKDTGKDIWTWRGEGPGYTSPVLAKISGVRQLISASHNMWIGLSPETGELLWSLPVRQNAFNHNSITPLIAGDTVVCGANQRPTFALKVAKAGGKWTPEKVWETRDITMSTSSPIRDGNRMYAVNEKRRGQIVCMELNSGKILWACPGNKGENVSLYDTGPSILAFDINGELFVYKKTVEGLQETARYTVADGASWSSPAIAGNKVLVKGAETLTLWEVPSS